MMFAKALFCTASVAALTIAGQAHAQNAAQDAAVSELVVTGTSIRGVAPVGAPVLQISRDDINSAVAQSPVELLRELPQIANIGADEARSGTGAQQANANTTRAQGINIRGLGTQATLTLVDGQRVAPAGLLVSSFDPATIPNIALSGIDVVADGASAIYGSDALAGVVNLILRKNFDGLEAAGSYGFADDYYDYRVSAIAGKTWSRGSAMIAGQFSYHPIFYAHYRPEFFLGAGTGPTRIPSNQALLPYQTTGSFPPTLTAGGVVYAVPEGGTAPVTAAQVLSGAGQRWVTNGWENTAIAPSQERASVVGNFNFEVSDSVELFGQAFFSRRTFLTMTGAGANQNLTVPATNPYAAFLRQLPGSPATGLVNFRFSELGPSFFEGAEDQGQAMLGARVNLWGDFQGEFTVAQNYSHSHRYIHNSVSPCGMTGQATNVSGPCTVTGGAIRGTTLETAFNPFGQNSQAMLDSLRGLTLQSFQVQMRQLRAKIDGTLFTIPGGGVKLAAGVDFQHQKNWFNNFSNLSGANNTEWRRNSGGTKVQDVTALFAEAVVPLIGEANAQPWARSLQLSLAGRINKYSLYSGTVENPKIGFTWEPNTDLAIRGSYSTSFRSDVKAVDPNNAPNVTLTLNNFFDYRCNCRVTALGRNGGNPVVTPETSRTWTLGADYSPSAVRGLNINATYFNIFYEDIIDQPGNTVNAGLTSARQEELYGAYARRRPPASDVAATAAFNAEVEEWLSHPTFTNPNRPAVSSVMFLRSGESWNSGSLKTQGVDFSASYLLPTSSGDWSFGLTGTYYLKYIRSLTPGDELINRIDFIDNPTRYRLRGRIGWSHGGWRASATANHMPGYRNTNVTPEAPVDAYTTIDTNVSYTLEGRSGLLNDITMSVGVRNLFDNDPPYALLNEDQTYDSSGGNPYGRTITVELRKRF